jgi:hypothetical protein
MPVGAGAVVGEAVVGVAVSGTARSNPDPVG